MFGPFSPTHLKEIGKIGAKPYAQFEIVRADIKITDDDSLVTSGVPNEFETVYMDQLAAQLVRNHSGIGEVDTQNRVVLLNVRAEQQ